MLRLGVVVGDRAGVQLVVLGGTKTFDFEYGERTKDGIQSSESKCIQFGVKVALQMGRNAKRHRLSENSSLDA